MRSTMLPAPAHQQRAKKNENTRRCNSCDSKNFIGHLKQCHILKLFINPIRCDLPNYSR